MNGQHDILFADYAADPSVTNRNRIVVAYIHLADRLTTVFRKRLDYADFDELRSVGYMGLIESVDRYDTSRGVPFDGFASRRVYGAMLDACRRIDVLSRTSRQRIKQWDEAATQFRQVHGFSPTDQEVEAELDIKPDSWKSHINAGEVTAALKNNYDWTKDYMSGQIRDDQPGPFEIAEANDGFESLLATESLWPEERQVLRLKFQADRTNKQIAGLYDCSESRISYMVKDARDKIAAAFAA